MKRRSFIKQGAGAITGLSLLPRKSCAGTLAAQPNIVFILCDQWRKQAVGFMGADRVLTPHLDALAARSARFSNAISTVPVCGPNRACLFSGKYPMRTGLLANDCYLLPEHQTFGEISKAAGYQTAYIGKWHLGDDSKTVPRPNRGYVAPQYRHGFDFWYKSEDHKPFRQPWFVGDAHAPSFPGGDWEPDHLEKVASTFVTGRDRNRPFAMTLSFAPPHTGGGPGFEDRFDPGKITATKTAEQLKGYGYAAPEKYEKLYVAGGSFYQRPVRENVTPMPGFEESKCVQGYFGAITAIDDALGRFFQTLEKEGELDNTIIVITSDHGELLGSHGRTTKGFWYQESAGIPMIVHYPAVVKPAQYGCVFNSIDVLPTILGLAGLPNPGTLDGTSFAPLLRGGPQKTPEAAFGSYYRGLAAGFETDTGWNQFRAVYTERYTYVLAHGNYASRAAKAKEILYDLQQDPYETKPILRGGGQDERMDHFKEMLVAHLNEINDPFMTEIWPVVPAETDWTTYRKMIAQTYF
jgi:arylsulfatase A-like enzyme